MAAGGRAKPAPATKAKPDHSATDRASPTLEYHPLAPRRRILAVLSMLFAAWMAFLIVLYFTTIAPRRSVAPEGGVSAAPPAESVAVQTSAHSNS